MSKTNIGKIGVDGSGIGKRINIVATDIPADTLTNANIQEGTNAIPKNSIIFSAPTDEDGNDVGNYSLLVTDNNSNVADFTYINAVDAPFKVEPSDEDKMSGKKSLGINVSDKYTINSKNEFDTALPIKTVDNLDNSQFSGPGTLYWDNNNNQSCLYTYDNCLEKLGTVMKNAGIISNINNSDNHIKLGTHDHLYELIYWMYYKILENTNKPNTPTDTPSKPTDTTTSVYTNYNLMFDENINCIDLNNNTYTAIKFNDGKSVTKQDTSDSNGNITTYCGITNASGQFEKKENISYIIPANTYLFSISLKQDALFPNSFTLLSNGISNEIYCSISNIEDTCDGTGKGYTYITYKTDKQITLSEGNNYIIISADSTTNGKRYCFINSTNGKRFVTGDNEQYYTYITSNEEGWFAAQEKHTSPFIEFSTIQYTNRRGSKFYNDYTVNSDYFDTWAAEKDANEFCMDMESQIGTYWFTANAITSYNGYLEGESDREHLTYIEGFGIGVEYGKNNFKFADYGYKNIKIDLTEVIVPSTKVEYIINITSEDTTFASKTPKIVYGDTYKLGTTILPNTLIATITLPNNYIFNDNCMTVSCTDIQYNNFIIKRRGTTQIYDITTNDILDLPDKTSNGKLNFDIKCEKQSAFILKSNVEAIKNGVSGKTIYFTKNEYSEGEVLATIDIYDGFTLQQTNGNSSTNGIVSSGKISCENGNEIFIVASQNVTSSGVKQLTIKTKTAISDVSALINDNNFIYTIYFNNCYDVTNIDIDTTKYLLVNCNDSNNRLPVSFQLYDTITNKTITNKITLTAYTSSSGFTITNPSYNSISNKYTLYISVKQLIVSSSTTLSAIKTKCSNNSIDISILNNNVKNGLLVKTLKFCAIVPYYSKANSNFDNICITSLSMDSPTYYIKYKLITNTGEIQTMTDWVVSNNIEYKTTLLTTNGNPFISIIDSTNQICTVKTNSRYGERTIIFSINNIQISSCVFKYIPSIDFNTTSVYNDGKTYYAVQKLSGIADNKKINDYVSCTIDVYDTQILSKHWYINNTEIADASTYVLNTNSCTVKYVINFNYDYKGYDKTYIASCEKTAYYKKVTLTVQFEAIMSEKPLTKHWYYWPSGSIYQQINYGTDTVAGASNKNNIIFSDKTNNVTKYNSPIEINFANSVIYIDNNSGYNIQYKKDNNDMRFNVTYDMTCDSDTFDFTSTDGNKYKFVLKNGKVLEKTSYNVKIKFIIDQITDINIVYPKDINYNGCYVEDVAKINNDNWYITVNNKKVYKYIRYDDK